MNSSVIEFVIMHSSWSAQSPLMVDRELLLVPVTVD